MRSAYRPFVWCMSVLLEIIWTTLRKEHLLSLHSAFPPRRGLRAPALLGLEILHGFQQPLIVLLARHQGGAKPGRRCNNTTWSLVGLSGGFAVGAASSTRLANPSCGIPVTWTKPRDWDLSFRRRYGSTFRTLREFHNCVLCREVSRRNIFAKIPSLQFAPEHSFTHYPRFITVGEDIGVGAENCGGMQKTFCPYFPNFAQKRFMQQTFSLYISITVATFYCPLPCYHRKQNRKFGTWRLVLTNPTKKYAGVRKNIVRGQLARYSEQLPHSTKVSRSVRIQAVAASKKPNTSLGYMGNMQQTAWRMCLSKHRT